MAFHLPLATHYGADFFLLLASPFLILFGILGVVAASGGFPKLLVIVGGVVLAVIYMISRGDLSYDNDQPIVLGFDFAAGTAIVAMNWIGTRKRDKWPKMFSPKPGTIERLAAMQLIVVGQLAMAAILVGILYMLLG